LVKCGAEAMFNFEHIAKKIAASDKRIGAGLA
jgi:hypothetical protein